MLFKCVIILLILSIYYLSVECRIICFMSSSSFRREGPAKFVPHINLDIDLCSEVIYQSAKLNPDTLLLEPSDYETDINKRLYKQTTDLKQKKSTLKVLLSITECETCGQQDFSRLVSNQTARKNFIQHMIEFLKEHNFDGIHIDWRFPLCWYRDCSQGPKSDKENFALLVHEIRIAFARDFFRKEYPQRLLLSVILPFDPNITAEAYDAIEIALWADYMIIHTLGYTDNSNKQRLDYKTGHISPIYGTGNELDVHSSITMWQALKAPKKKIIIIIPAFGFTFTLRDANNTGIGAPASGKGISSRFISGPRGQIPWYEICNLLESNEWITKRDERNGPWAYSRDDQWISFDDEESVAKKVGFVRELKLGGVAFMDVSQDDFEGRFCSKGKYPLLKQIAIEIKGQKTVAPEEVGKTKPLITQSLEKLESEKNFPVWAIILITIISILFIIAIIFMAGIFFRWRSSGPANIQAQINNVQTCKEFPDGFYDDVTATEYERYQQVYRTSDEPHYMDVTPT